MTTQNKTQLFEQQQVRSVWDAEREKWYISVIDVVAVLTESPRPRKYWDDLKRKLQAEGSELSEKIGQLKMQAPDGKMRMTDVAAPSGHPFLFMSSLAFFYVIPSVVEGPQQRKGREQSLPGASEGLQPYARDGSGLRTIFSVCVTLLYYSLRQRT